MNRIISKQRLSENVVRLEVKAPVIAAHAKAGQFVVLRVNENGERIPLTIASFDEAAGSISLIFQEVGTTTKLLGALEVNDNISDIVGPLGHPTELTNYGTVILVGGGVGVAEALPVATALRKAGNRVIGITGARTKNLIILEAEMKAACDEVFVMTDDGSYGKKGFVTEQLQELLGKKITVGMVYAIGPVPMMRAVADLTKNYGIKTIVSLNPIMLDGTGMCGVCRCSIAGKTKFACVDGPEFDGHQVDWKELIARQSTFKTQEKQSFERMKTNG
jgi:ferredoxin--NADP+ reductase